MKIDELVTDMIFWVFVVAASVSLYTSPEYIRGTVFIIWCLSFFVLWWCMVDIQKSITRRLIYTAGENKINAFKAGSERQIQENIKESQRKAFFSAGKAMAEFGEAARRLGAANNGKF